MAVGANVSAPGATAIDAQGRVVMPGLIDTHWHMWHTLFRGMSGDKREDGFFPTVTRFSGSMSAQEMYASTRLAAVEAVNAGITSIHSWCHNIRSRAHAEADLRAINDTGLRGRWSFGQAIDQSPDKTILLAELEAMHKDWRSYSNEGLVSLGMAWRGIYRGNAYLPTEVYKTEFDTARRLGLPITVHIGTVKAATQGHIEGHAKQGLLGPDVNIVHGCSASAEEIKMVKEFRRVDEHTAAHRDARRLGLPADQRIHERRRTGWPWHQLERACRRRQSVRSVEIRHGDGERAGG